MIKYNVITAICFALFTLCALYVIISFILKNRAERIKFIRGFKRGKCVAIFLIAIPLLSIGYIYNGETVIDGILSAISHLIDFVVLKFNISKVNSLIEANLFYRITVYYCCILVILNAILFALSFIGQQVWQGWNKLVRIFTRKAKLFIFGNNENSVSIYKSNKKFCATVVDKISGEDGLELYKKKIKFISRDNYDSLVTGIIKRALKNKEYTVVINTQSDEQNLSICNLFIDKINACAEKKEDLFNQLRIYVFGDPKFEAIYGDVVESAYGCIRYKNKYQMLAMDFIDKYPLTKFMDDTQIDYATSLIKPEVDINVCMIGFGKPNRQIFLTSVANNQFLTETKNGIGLKQVNYHIFDKQEAEKNKNLNHLYYRFKNEFKEVNPADYLPFPEQPANEECHHLDVNDPQYYEELREVITENPLSVNFVIVSFRSDLENIDMAQKLVEKRREWGVKNLVIFVRTKQSHEDLFKFRDNGVYFIGDESKCVYDIEKITNDKIYKMARMRNEVYDLEYDITHADKFVMTAESILKNRENANRKWFTEKCRLERESSLYCCLSLQSKLNLMGLEYCKEDENAVPGMTETEYINYYAGEDVPDTKSYGLEVDGKKIVKYTLDFPQSRRRNLAVLEHLRWNSFMISKGIVPATKECIINDTFEKDGKTKHSNGKNYKLRRHGNLTTFEGLTEFRKMILDRDGGPEAEHDVIKYDYQLLDDAYWLLSKNRYKIIRIADKTKYTQKGV